jgi:anti-sigma factor RsiW
MSPRLISDRSLRAYARGRLTPRKRAAIEHALQSDPALRTRLHDLAGLPVILQGAVALLRRDEAVRRLQDWLRRVLADPTLS